MRKGGFTIVELVIAVAVATILTAVGVARYNAYIQDQSFISSVQNVVACIQRGQQMAVQGQISSAARYSKVDISRVMDNSNQTAVVCSQSSWSSTSVSGVFSGGTQIGSTSTDQNDMFVKVKSVTSFVTKIPPPTTYSNPVQVSLVFGSNEHGSLIYNRVVDSGGLAQNSNMENYSNGFPVELVLQDVGSTKTATITIPPTGVQVRYATP